MSSGPARFARSVLDHPWYIVVAIIAAAIIWFTYSTRQQSHYVQASFSSAFNLVPGLDVQIDGVDVGKLGKVDYVDGQANVQIGIDDEEYWPLHEGTTATSRWGTTIGSGTRKIDIEPGPESNRELPEDGIIEMQHTQPAVDVDQVLNTFSAEKREQVQKLSDHMNKGLKGDDVNDALKAAPDGVQAAGGLMADLATDTNALRGLVRNTDRLMGTLASRRDQVSDLVTVVAATFDEFADNSQSIEQGLAEAPSAFREVRSTLGRVDSSVDVLEGTIEDLRPGAGRLQPLAAAATPTLSDLRRTVPSAVSTIRTATRAAPRVENLLEVGQPFFERADSALGDLAPMVGCIRPYAPELGGAIVSGASWIQGYYLAKNDDDKYKAIDAPTRYVGRKGPNGTRYAHGVRAQPQFSAASLHSYPPSISTEAFTKLTGKSYAFPRAPGLIAGDPQFNEECGYGPDSLNPALDPEEKE